MLNGYLLEDEIETIQHTDSLPHDIELLCQIPGGRQFFKEIVKDAKTKIAKKLGQQKIE